MYILESVFEDESSFLILGFAVNLEEALFGVEDLLLFERILVPCFGTILIAFVLKTGCITKNIFIYIY